MDKESYYKLENRINNGTGSLIILYRKCLSDYIALHLLIDSVEAMQQQHLLVVEKESYYWLEKEIDKRMGLVLLHYWYHNCLSNAMSAVQLLIDSIEAKQ